MYICQAHTNYRVTSIHTNVPKPMELFNTKWRNQQASKTAYSMQKTLSDPRTNNTTLTVKSGGRIRVLLKTYSNYCSLMSKLGFWSDLLYSSDCQTVQSEIFNTVFISPSFCLLKTLLLLHFSIQKYSGPIYRKSLRYIWEMHSMNAENVVFVMLFCNSKILCNSITKTV